MPKKVRNLDPSLWGSSGVATVGGGDDDMVDVKQHPKRGFQELLQKRGLANRYAPPLPKAAEVADGEEVDG